MPPNRMDFDDCKPGFTNNKLRFSNSGATFINRRKACFSREIEPSSLLTIKFGSLLPETPPDRPAYRLHATPHRPPPLPCTACTSEWGGNPFPRPYRVPLAPRSGTLQPGPPLPAHLAPRPAQSGTSPPGYKVELYSRFGCGSGFPDGSFVRSSGRPE